MPQLSFYWKMHSIIGAVFMQLIIVDILYVPSFESINLFKHHLLIMKRNQIGHDIVLMFLIG